MSETKRCSRCKKVKSVVMFFKDRTRSDGVDNKCKKCRQILRKKREKSAMEEKYRITEMEIYGTTETEGYGTTETERYRRKKKKEVRQLHDSYIKNLINLMSGLPRKDITKEIIDLKRDQLTIHRLLNKTRNVRHE